MSEDLVERDYAYRFEYADGSAFQIYEDGTAFVVFKDGRREQKAGKIDNRIRLLIGSAVKPRQDEIESLRLQLGRARGVIWDIANSIPAGLSYSPGFEQRRFIETVGEITKAALTDENGK